MCETGYLVYEMEEREICVLSAYRQGQWFLSAPQNPDRPSLRSAAGPFHLRQSGLALNPNIYLHTVLVIRVRGAIHPMTHTTAPK